LNVVLVEDNNDTRKLASRLLEQRGFRVTEFSDGETASQYIPEICPDIAIIDIGLPGKSGLDLAREFRSNKCLDNTMLIALTGYGQESDKEEFEIAGFDLHLVKPADFDALIGAISRWSSTNHAAK
jgi:two-component system CheB/CheR fusion protein